MRPQIDFVNIDQQGERENVLQRRRGDRTGLGWVPERFPDSGPAFCQAEVFPDQHTGCASIGQQLSLERTTRDAPCRVASLLSEGSDAKWSVPRRMGVRNCCRISRISRADPTQSSALRCALADKNQLSPPPHFIFPPISQPALAGTEQVESGLPASIALPAVRK